MQLVSKYLLNNNVTLTANLAGEITEYRSVYQRNLNLVRGIDNVIQFNVLNADQKPVSILNTYTPKFQLYDESNRLIVESSCETNSSLLKAQNNNSLQIDKADFLQFQEGSK